ncbi:N-acetylmuramoyl-L-alanine amidase [Candidatus Pelagibacter sp.]|nr:N-acetylmuramoyl-L-alanine amidase [Candidatus Pelagibacter sp.]
MVKINNNYSPNFSLPKRKKKNIKFVILHYTGMKKESLVSKRFWDEKSKVSAHYFIKKNGQVVNFVPELYEAWHAGKSKWKKERSLNKYSIGIEIQNPGHNYKYVNFTLKQIITIKKLLKKIIKKYKIELRNILGHSDIAPERKKDPGEKFPWKKLSTANLAIWHNISELDCEKLRLKKLNKKQEKSFLNNLYYLGYNRIKKTHPNFNKKILFTAFQRRFRQKLVNGKSDHECLEISKSLLKS